MIMMIDDNDYDDDDDDDDDDEEDDLYRSPSRTTGQQDLKRCLQPLSFLGGLSNLGATTIIFHKICLCQAEPGEDITIVATIYA